MSDVTSGKELYEFGPFRIDVDKQILLRAGGHVPLTPKTFQILLVPVRHGKKVVTKDDLMKAVWPDTFVEETNLTRNVFALRKALGEGKENRYIVTLPGRGYRFAEEVRLVPGQEIDIETASHSTLHVPLKGRKSWLWICLAVVLLSAIAAGTIRLLLARRPVLTGTGFSYVPTLHALLALNNKKPLNAIEQLRMASRYELGSPAADSVGFVGALYPVYVRGEAYLAAKQGAEAAAEFQKILDHRGIAISDPIGALAHLQLGRAYVLSRDRSRASSSYEDFLALWKDADAGIPVLKQAKAEYGELQLHK